MTYHPLNDHEVLELENAIRMCPDDADCVLSPCQVVKFKRLLATLRWKQGIPLNMARDLRELLGNYEL